MITSILGVSLGKISMAAMGIGSIGIGAVKLGEYVDFIKPEYIYLRLIPNNSIKNNSTSNIAKTIASMHKHLLSYIHARNGKLVRLLGKEILIGTDYYVEPRPKVSYYIYMENKRISFYFIVPKICVGMIKERSTESWKGVTIEEVTELPGFKDSATKYKLLYKNEDALSLKADERTNELIDSNLNIVSMLEEGDKAGLFYNFIPISQHSWFNSYRGTIEKVRKNQPVDRNKAGVAYLAKLVFGTAYDLMNDVAYVLNGKPKSAIRSTVSKGGGKQNAFEQAIANIVNPSLFSKSTIKKGRDVVINTQILVLSESKSKVRQVTTARSLCQSYVAVEDDNSLDYKRFKGDFDPLAYSVGGASNKMSTKEIANFVSLPGREILERYKFIEKVQTQESEVAKELRSGTMCIGTSTLTGTTTEAYVSSDFDFQFLSLVIMGPNRAGKSKLLANLAKDAIDNGECVIIPDYIGTCQLSKEIASVFPKNKVLTIECDVYEQLQGMGYNEVPKSTDPFKQYEIAKKQTQLLMTLVDSINMNGADLTARMGRFFESASLVVALQHGPIKDVFAVLMDHTTRHDYIGKLRKEHKESMEEYISYLHELDETDKKGKPIGTKMHLISGAIDRLHRLKANAYIETMLKKGMEKNHNLVDEFQKNQLIVIKMPQDMFLTDNEKDVYVTYWLTKVWLALQVRDARFKSDRTKMKKVNLIIDELYQVNNAEIFLKEKLSQLPKFNIKPIISCHYLNQLKVIREEFRSANASYMLIAGSDKQNYKELKSELYPYTEEDLLSLKRFHSLNLIKCESGSGYSTFVTKLPTPVS